MRSIPQSDERLIVEAVVWAAAQRHRGPVGGPSRAGIEVKRGFWVR